MTKLCGIGLCCLVFASCLAARADVSVSLLFTDHMVLQREKAVPVFGSAEPGEKVKVEFRGQAKETVADENGKWRVMLDPLEAGGPDTLTISGANTITVNDVLVGEVWVGSGQSNMAGAAKTYAKRDEVLAAMVAAAPYPEIRLLHARLQGWQVAEAASIDRFSALLFAFGKNLHADLGVPVGLMVGAVGGTPSVRWLTQEMLVSDAECRRQYEEGIAKNTHATRMEQHEARMAAWEKRMAAFEAEGKTPDPRMVRKPVAPAPPGPFEELKAGDLFAAHIRPFVGYGMRGALWDQGEAGTRVHDIDQKAMMGALIAGWRKAWEQGEFPFIYVQKPSGGGCAWDPEGDPVTRGASKFAAQPVAQPPQGDGKYRELHISIMEHPNTAMVIARDLAGSVHPPNKSGYGARAARVAKALAYGQDVVIYGPRYASHKIEGNRIRIAFTDVGQGLAFKHGDRLQGFTIAGADKAFQWADAEIDGDTVVVSCEQVAEPKAVRYAWAQIAPWANLFNKDGLPALTFRADDW